MKSARKHLIQLGLSLALLAFVVAGVFFHKSIRGWYDYRFKKWEEDAFKGKPLSQLQQDLETRKQTLEWCDIVGFGAITDRDLASDQRVMIFLKGKTYPWFWSGTAQNAGYVVIQNTTNGEVVIDILRTVYMDSL